MANSSSLQENAHVASTTWIFAGALMQADVPVQSTNSRTVLYGETSLGATLRPIRCSSADRRGCLPA